MKLAFGLTCLTSVLACAVAGRQKGEMGSGSDNDVNANAGYQRNLASENDYKYKKHYVTIVKPEDSVFDFVNGVDLAVEYYTNLVAGIDSTTVMGMSFTQAGRVYDPADIQMVNKFAGVTRDDPMPPSFTYEDIPSQVFESTGGLRYQGNRQPKTPIPAGDAAYFHHGQCTPNSGISDRMTGPQALSITSQTCLYNLCLGGGGFDCIAILAGSAYSDNLAHAITYTHDSAMSMMDQDQASGISGNELPPPIRATILGGTGSFEGIEGTVDIATIAGTAGYNFYHTLNALNVIQTSRFDIGYKVQTITVNSNTPLPTAP